MSRRALIYVATNLLDAGLRPEDLVAPLLQVAQGKGLEVAGVFHEDRIAALSPRPQFSALVQQIQAGDVILTPSLHRLFASSREMALRLRPWLDSGIDVVTLEEDLDTTAPAVRGSLFLSAGFWCAAERRRHEEATQAGILRSKLKNSGVWGRSRQLLAYSIAEIRVLWQNEGLSQDQVVARFKSPQRHGQISKGKLNPLIRQLIASGDLDPVARDVVRAARKARDKAKKEAKAAAKAAKKGTQR